MDGSTLQSVFTSILDRDTVNRRALALGAVVRVRKIEPYDLVLALLRASGTGASRTIAAVRRAWELLTGTTVSESAFEERFNGGLVRLLWELFETVTRPVPRALRREWPRPMRALRDVLITDGSRIALGQSLAEVFRGTGPGQAGIKLLARLSLSQGQLDDIRAGAAVHHDRRLLRLGEAVAGALYLMDLGFYDHTLFAQLDDAKSYFVSRLKEGVVATIASVSLGVIDARRAVGRRIDDALRTRATVDVDARFRSREEESGERVFRVVKVTVPRCDRHDHWVGGHHAFWFVTNLPRETWTAEMIAALYRLRWWVERAFRQLKTLARLDQIRSERPSVVFAFMAASLIVWALGASIVRELESDVGVGAVSHDRVHACLVEALADVTMLLACRPEAMASHLRGLAAVLRREGRHPNPGSPRRITTVFETIELEARLQAAA